MLIADGRQGTHHHGQSSNPDLTERDEPEEAVLSGEPCRQNATHGGLLNLSASILRP